MNDYNKDLEDRVIKLEEEIERRNDVILDLLHVYRAVNASLSVCLANTDSKNEAERLYKKYKRTVRTWADPVGHRPFGGDWAVALEQVDAEFFPCIETARNIIKE